MPTIAAEHKKGPAAAQYVRMPMRKANLRQLLARRPEGILRAPVRTGRNRPGPVRTACNLGREGWSANGGTGDNARRCRVGVKVKNRSRGQWFAPRKSSGEPRKSRLA